MRYMVVIGESADDFGAYLPDLVDKESSKELISSLKLLRPRHLPLVATIGDRDLNATVSEQPKDIKEVFTQSAAEEIIHQRETALRSVESLGEYNRNFSSLQKR